jgi:hypothetical protein
MRWARKLAVISLVLIAAPAWAQSEDTRPATTTIMGDTGLWFVPTANTLRKGSLSVSVQRTESDYRQGNTNVSFFPLTGAVGFGRAELFGSLRMITRIDRDTTPLFFAGPNNEAGGLVNLYPAFHESFSGNQLGDLYLGGKFNLLSEAQPAPIGLAVRATVKVPTADSDLGIGTGEYDGILDFIASREVGGAELTGFGGWAIRGDPADIKLADTLRWGLGAGFPTRSSLRLNVEAFGEHPFSDDVTAPSGFVVATDGSLSPAASHIDDAINTALGITWQHRGGLLLGAGITYRFALAQKDPASGTPESTSGDAVGLQFRIGFHRGVKTYVPPPPPVALSAPAPAPAPAPEPAAPPPPAANRAPTVRAACDPCTVMVGQTAALRAEVLDPDGDPVTVRWSVSGGTLSDTRAANTSWRAEAAPGVMTATVTVEDSRGGTASDTVSLSVAGDESLEFEDVHFEFDRYTLRPEALAVLQAVVTSLQQRAAIAARHRGAHVQHRHGRVQPGARRSTRERRARLPRPARHRRRPPVDVQLR